ncbi:MAG: mechanosensitive ion channel [Candidatus Andeanibacterium colombiense]|uniref:Mechanosensitive ion channel n=1 Tax=Candidatus Andeanibacterium colombiense TaxID=3121345 RepID=A0AAJ5X1X3_9SPHN|nr:MAG: mechanosensitive ion channel [Sphingomonadaceae bacterium]
MADTPVVGADGIKHAVAQGNSHVGGWIEWLDSYGLQVGSIHLSLWSAAVFFAVIFAVILFGRLGGKLAHRVMARLTSLDPAQQLLAEKLVSIFVWALAILIGIDVLGIDLTALAVFSGAFGLAIGFGLQKTFGNLLAGIILLMDRSIKPGDVIAVSDLSGRESFGQIRRIGLRAISVTTRDMKEYLIPNENLMINQVENWSYSSRDVRIKAPIRVAYGSDIELVEKLLLDACDASPRVLDLPQPTALIVEFGESAINFEIRFWVQDPEEGISNVRSDVYKRAWKLFQENGIRLPYPQLDVHFQDARPAEMLARGPGEDRSSREKPR